MAFDVQQRQPQPPATGNNVISHDVPPWVHFAAGASGGLINATITSPLDVLRTRMQSDLYPTPSSRPPPHTPLILRPVYDTFAAIGAMRRAEGLRGLFRGLMPSLAGVVPAQAVKFYVYGNCKRFGTRLLGRAEGDVLVHAQAAVAAGLATATATNPIWLIKTRLQLDDRRYGGVLDCVRQVLRREGVAGMYKGLSASYLGALETVVHLVLYERLKTALRGEESGGELAHWAGTAGAAGGAKVVAVLIAYPHEVCKEIGRGGCDPHTIASSTDGERW
ncbi:Mitochondrial substrate carrier [Cordyceps fumosorosea ARSEF 2679]|uniref:Mitochondrial substrate carrier n=1 Tax=Cordyceps fumosorosea (strain ARSEF 2679) TaxID=1081104 RepID=A0A162J2U0_CORFA|nr:Mitochondrial substrate carrier [Cordyceps fumosorosea ARSEF 2679]OAA62982.1 Mitochondrial substrate carrier [Cordyceps fumosorosea ARSEF 2679]